MRNGLWAATILLATSGGWAAAQAPVPGHTPKLLIDVLQPAAAPRLRVSAREFGSGDDMPLDTTLYGKNRSPALAWSRGPAGTRAYAVVVQGAAGSAGGAPTSIHLTLYNLPASVTALPGGLGAELPAGAAYGPNVHGDAEPYSGPHTHDAVKREYHFQVFALDRPLAVQRGAPFDAILAAMRGHVLAAGEVVGRSAMPAGADVATASKEAVRIDTGLVGGVPGRDPAVTAYKGIPFAAPPVGRLRFRPPAPALPWSGLRIADSFGPACPQPAGGGPAPAVMSEDCLTLNVWTGSARSAEKRPVLVWIYGGGFIGGTGSSPEFDGEGLARKGVIVVTFNYRVGALGFLATPELSRESGHGASGNYGLLDDIAALKWVQRNIAAFGGDPAKVTIAGQSAGAGSVGFLTLSPLARGLFRAGIAESHSRDPGDPALRFLSVSYRTRASAEAAGARYAAAHGAGNLAALRALPWQKLIEGSNTIDEAVDTGTAAKPPLFRPVIDNWVIPRTYRAALDARAQAPVLLITGNNKDETGAVPETAIPILRKRTEPPRAGAPEVVVTLAEYLRSARRRYGAMTDEFLRLYPARTDDEAARASNAAARDVNRVSTYLWGAAWSKGSPRPLYTYWWTHAPPGPGAELRGAYHGSEINYVFNNLYATSRPWSDEDRRIADLMSSYWANFVKTGDPNGEGLPIWPTFDPSSPTVMQLGEGWHPVPVASPPKLDFWRRYFAQQAQW